MRAMAGNEMALLNGAIAAVRQPGVKTPILLLHGNSSCKEAFRAVWPTLGELGHEVLAVDLPGHGVSLNAVFPMETYTFLGYSRIVGAVIDELGWTEVIVVGWSLGGHIALQAMIDDSRLKAALVIGTPPGKPSLETFEAAFTADPSTRLAGAADFTAEDALAYTRSMLGVSDPDPMFVAMAQRTDGRARVRLIESVVAGVGADQRLAYGSGSRPVAVVVGADDPFLRIEYLAALDSSKLWGGRVHILADTGHAPHANPTGQFTALLTEFITSVASAS